MNLKRLQSLAEAVGWKIECGIGNYVLTTNMGTSIHFSLTPIRERLAKEYRRLAEQSKYQMDILEATGYLCNMKDYRATHFTRIADELSVPEEPTECLVCRELLKYKDAASGLLVNCPKCHTPVVFPKEPLKSKCYLCGGTVLGDEEVEVRGYVLRFKHRVCPPKEPIMVERIKKHQALCREQGFQRSEHLIFDALIDLYERKER